MMALLIPAMPSYAQDAQSPDTTVIPKAGDFPRLQSQLQRVPPAKGDALLLAAPSTSAAPDAVTATSPRNAKSQSTSQERGVSRARNVTLAPTPLNDLMTAQDLRMDAAGNVVGTPRQFTLTLFDDVVVHLVKVDKVRDVLGHDVLRAAVVSAEGGEATLVMDHGQITGKIRVGARTFGIQPDVNGLHRVIEYDESTIPIIDNDALRPPASPSPAPGTTTPAPSGQIEHATNVAQAAANATTLRILVVYTAKALSLRPNITSDISLFISNLNSTLSNSNTNVTAVLVGTSSVNYVETSSTDMTTMLNDATNGTGDFARIAQVRANMGADLVQVWGVPSDGCGLAWTNDDLDTKGSSLHFYTRYGTSVIEISASGGCIASAYDAPSHEIGHNVGAQHDRYTQNLQNDTNIPGPQGYNYGYIDAVGHFSDVMSYGSQSVGANQCNDQHFSCPHIPYYSNPNVSYNGRPVGIADSQAAAADNARRIGEIAPYVAQFHTFLASSASANLLVTLSGTGTVTSSTGGINCGTICSSGYSANQSVTLTATAPAGWAFSSWSGACSGTTPTCTLTVSGTTNVTATFIPAVRFGPVFASGQPSSSFLRFVNTGSTAGTVTVILADYVSGNVLNRWTSPSIAPGAAPQYGINTLEVGISSSARPLYYSVTAETTMTGYAQHVLWRQASGTLTNLSTCEQGVSASQSQVANVHSSLVGAQGYPSTISLNNTGVSAVQVTLGIYDAITGSKLGTYQTAAVPATGQLNLTMSAIETGANVTPLASRSHYVVRVESSFTGFLQHLVDNQVAGVVTDMTTTCLFNFTATSTSAQLMQTGPIYSSAQAASQSFLRFLNTGSNAGTVGVTLRDYASGTRYGRWVSPSIPVGTAPQFAIHDIEAGANVGATKPQFYTAQIDTNITGSFAHVLWKPSNGTLTNLSTVTQHFHQHRPGGQRPFLAGGNGRISSSVIVTNTGTAAAQVTLGVYSALDGSKLGTYTTTSIPAGGQLGIPSDTLEKGINFTPQASLSHYVVKVESSFTGFLQHLVSNVQASVLTDMTTVCKLPALVGP